MPVIRVGFFLGQVGWLGGVNYFRNLFTAIQSLPETTVQPVIFSGLKSDVSAFEGLAEIIRTPVLDRKSFTWTWLLSKFFSRICPRRDYVLYLMLRRHRIDVISHVGGLWRGCPIPSIGWIPDFQHIHLPQFFTEQEVADRDKEFSNRINQSDAILLSSDDALNDLKTFCPKNTTPAHVLHFVSCLDQNAKSELAGFDIQKRYQFNQPWFHVPNQFWAHKNHGIVIDALRILKQQGKELLVVATGSTEDHRNPNYFIGLKKKIEEYGLKENFLILGVLPYPEVVALMRNSIAVINPSFFEGWSTTVEEAKSLGKRIILSDIAVHKEQDPQRATFFNPTKAKVLAEKMEAVLQEFNPILEEKFNLSSQVNIELRKYEFAKNYERIVLQVLKGANGFS